MMARPQMPVGQQTIVSPQQQQNQMNPNIINQQGQTRMMGPNEQQQMMMQRQQQAQQQQQAQAQQQQQLQMQRQQQLMQARYLKKIKNYIYLEKEYFSNLLESELLQQILVVWVE